MTFMIRTALAAEKPELEQLIKDSTARLSREDYTAEEIHAANEYVHGVDSELIGDGTYFVVEHQGTKVACGGWSKRKTLFGGDRFGARASGLLDPETDPAKIRAFFVHPDWARKGIGRLLLKHCEAEAQKNGFSKTQLMSTLPGLKFYINEGYNPGEREYYAAPNGVNIPFVPMHKSL